MCYISTGFLLQLPYGVRWDFQLHSLPSLILFFILLLSFLKKEKSGCVDYLLLLPNKNMLSFAEIRSPVTALAYSGPPSPEGLGLLDSAQLEIGDIECLPRLADL